MTMEELCAIEPRLTRLLEEAKAVEDDGESESFCVNRLWYADGGFRERLSQMVGFDVGKRELQDSEIYYLAHYEVYRLLPDCRNCACWE